MPSTQTFPARRTGFKLAAAVAVLCAASLANAQQQVGHNKVVPILDADTPILKRFQPRLLLGGSCAPFPAVDWWGNWSGGLQASGLPHNSGCGTSPKGGQIYARHAQYGNSCALMYAWYFPRDSNAHRHDWENIVVWLDHCDVNSPIRAISYSAHGKYQIVRRNFLLDGTHPKVMTTLGFSFSVAPTVNPGGYQAMVDWNRLSPAARTALDRSWGKANFPMGGRFWGELDKAR